MSVDHKYPRATHAGEVEIAGTTIPCAVLEDGRRVLTQQGFLKAIGRARSAKGGQGATVDGVIPVLAAKNLQPYVDAELREMMQPVPFITASGRPGYAFPADCLPKVCEVYLRLRDAKEQSPAQERIIAQCDILMRGLATVGVVALVDEATGYQYDRASDALSQILNLFISNELNKWAKTFPDEYYKQLFRLRGITYDEFSTKRPRYIGHDTNDIVYKRLAPEVLDELKALTPKDHKGRRKHKFFMRLTTDVGHPKLREHLSNVITLMRVSDDMESFRTHLDKASPRYTLQGALDFEASLREAEAD